MISEKNIGKGKGCPVDILYIIEFNLNLDVLPIPGLKLDVRE
jgi:hypothetical protein